MVREGGREGGRNRGIDAYGWRYGGKARKRETETEIKKDRERERETFHLLCVPLSSHFLFVCTYTNSNEPFFLDRH